MQALAHVLHRKNDSIEGSLGLWTAANDRTILQGVEILRLFCTPLAHLEYIDNSGNESCLKLVDGMTVSIGRNPGSAVYTSNPSVSRNHGRISQENGHWSITDLGSSNGTYVNDCEDRIEAHQLASDDRVRCGDFVIRFVDKEDPTEERTQSRPDPFTLTNDGSSADRAQRTLRPRKTSHPTDAALNLIDGREKRTQSKKASKAKEPTKTKSKSPEFSKEDNEQLVDQIKSQGDEIERLTTSLNEHASMVENLEDKLSDMETKATRYELELDSITEKYVQIKDQLTVQKERLEDTREELADRDDRIFQLEGQISELEDELMNSRNSASGSSEQISGLKIKVTQKDRQIEEIQRQLDLGEFEFRAVKEELQALQDDHNMGAGDTQKLEKKINQLREIIADKENVISQARQDLENKDIELRQVRMGMGLRDLEDEKQKLLQDFYDKNREVDKLQDDLKAAEHTRHALESQVQDLEAEIERKDKLAQDITLHPDYKARVRECNRLTEEIEELNTTLEDAQEQLTEFTPEARKKMQGEIAFFQRKNSALEEKLEEAKAQLEAASPTPKRATHTTQEIRAAAQLVAMKSSLVEQTTGALDAVAQFRGNFSLFKTYLKDVSEFLTTNKQTGGSSEDATEADSPEEAMAAVEDLLRVVNADAKAIKQGLSNIQAAMDN